MITELVSTAAFAGGGSGIALNALMVIKDIMVASRDAKKAEAETNKAIINLQNQHAESVLKQHLQPPNEVELTGDEDFYEKITNKKGEVREKIKKNKYRKEQLAWNPVTIALSVCVVVIVVVFSLCIGWASFVWAVEPSTEIPGLNPNGGETVYGFLFDFIRITSPNNSTVQNTTGAGLLGILTMAVYALTTVITALTGRMIARR